MVDSPAHTVAGNPLLETKLYIPKWRGDLVSRPRLIERMQQGIERKLTLISAPAGFGKSTLLAEWLAGLHSQAPGPSGERAAAWVSLDQSDNDPAFFWTYFIAALQKIRSEVGGSALAVLRSPQPPPFETVLTNLINDLNAIEQDFTLILDDYHVIDSPVVHNTIAFLLDHIPPQMHLIIASRSDPPLPMARFRARGELTELRAADLRFTSGEAAAFLNDVMGLKLSAKDVAALEMRTEGWITGLQLAALSMQSRDDVAGFITAFTGNDRYIVDYLVEEVLQRQPKHVRSFLLQTSILDRLSGPLCDAVRFGSAETPSSSEGTAVASREDGKRMLARLERDNLFVVPLDDKRQWYRYHHLFAEVLRAHAMEEQRDQIPTLRRRAAMWFEEAGMAAEAIEQAQTAGDHETVARLLAANFDEFERLGRYASIARWAASLPEDMVRKRPRLALLHASVALISENNNQTARRLASWAEEAIVRIERSGGFEPAEEVNGTVVGPEGLEVLKGEMLALKLFTSGRKLRSDEIAALAEQALELLPPSKHRVRGMLHMIKAGMQTVFSDLRSALPNIEKSVEEARRSQNSPLLVDMLTLRGQVHVVMGRLAEGRRSFEEALVSGQNLSAEGAWVLCSPHTSLAEILLERGDLAGAFDHTSRALEFASKSPTRSPVLYAHAGAAQVFLAKGDTKAALEQLEQAQAFVRGSSDSRYFSFLSSVMLKIYCRTGDLERAADVVQDRKLSPEVAIDRNNEEETTAYARYLIARGYYDEAQQVLSKVLPIVQNIGRVQHEIDTLVLEAQARALLNDRALALESLGRATLLGESGRFTRSFASAGPAIAELMKALADVVRLNRGPKEAGSHSYIMFLVGEMNAGPERAAVQSAAAGLVEPLTAREIEILRLIVAGMRNQGIADHLFISLHTVKRHIANVYGKLEVTHRTAAVARAKELKLL